MIEHVTGQIWINGKPLDAGATGHDGPYTRLDTYPVVSLKDFSYYPPEPKPVKLVLPHKRHLVPIQQKAKRREWLRAQGLRK